MKAFGFLQHTLGFYLHRQTKEQKEKLVQPVYPELVFPKYIYNNIIYIIIYICNICISS